VGKTQEKVGVPGRMGRSVVLTEARTPLTSGVGSRGQVSRYRALSATGTTSSEHLTPKARWRGDSSGEPGSLTDTMHIKDQPKDGRTSGYDVGIAETICERLLNGESLRAICADPAMPARATVFRWLARNQEFRRSYADYVKTTGVDGKVTLVFDKENFARQRLRIKARKMILARMTPRKYGSQ
jgi:hypothetical protein